jgi:hypothetical protein
MEIISIANDVYQGLAAKITDSGATATMDFYYIHSGYYCTYFTYDKTGTYIYTCAVEAHQNGRTIEDGINPFVISEGVNTWEKELTNFTGNTKIHVIVQENSMVYMSLYSAD